jgi:hypothetical protein
MYRKSSLLKMLFLKKRIQKHWNYLLIKIYFFIIKPCLHGGAL